MTEQQRDEIVAKYAGKSGGPEAETIWVVTKAGASFYSCVGSEVANLLQRIDLRAILSYKDHGDGVSLDLDKRYVRKPYTLSKVRK